MINGTVKNVSCMLHVTNNLLRNEGDNLNKTIKFMLFEQKDCKVAYNELSKLNHNLSEMCLLREEK